ncbi:unnamed protein product [Symbiodinium pilosum]|uniref:Uncharacterized protein n=1 Tax=Symbiodinium pilosum TaxID=2952 RepID=A0A812S5B1_SYMPI|nr:unnamed protein product [Symbiodinium pilosum]
MGRPQYPLCSSMHGHLPGCAPIGGPGTVLCMNWFVLVAALGIWLSALAFWFAPRWKQKHLDATLAWKCNLQHLHPDERHELWAGLSYIGATVMSAIFLMWQSLLWTRMTHDTAGDICLDFYCVESSGFPPDATNKQELLAYFSGELYRLGLPPDGVEYISIGYKFTPDEAILVEHAIEKHLEEEDAHDPASPRNSPSNFEHSPARVGPLSKRAVTRSVGEAEIMELQAMTGEWSDSSDGEDSDPGGFWVQLLASVLCGTPFVCCDASVDPQTLFRHDLLEEELDLDRFPSSGLVFVVLKMEPVAVAFASAKVLPGLFRGTHEIRVTRCKSSPQTIVWSNFHVDSGMFWQRAVLSFFVLLATLVVWFGLYFPFYRLSMSVGSYNVTSDLAVGMSNFAGLFIVCGCELSHGRLTTPANVCLDFFVRPLVLDSQVCIMPDCTGCLAGEKVTAWGGGGQFKLTDNLVYLLFPSYVLLPYLVEPVATIAFSFYVAILRIKCDNRITPGQAEIAMMAPETDLKVPLADLICTTSTIISTFLLGPSMYHRFFFLLMVVFCAVAYAQYRVRVLRWDSACFQGTKSLHACQSAYWCFPLGLLAAAWEREWKRVPSTDVVTGLEPEVPSSQLSYSQALSQLGGKAGLADYLNTNPIEVLKSLNTPHRLIYYRPDKEYLQRRASKFTPGDTGFMMSMLTHMQKDATSVVPRSVWRHALCCAALSVPPPCAATDRAHVKQQGKEGRMELTCRGPEVLQLFLPKAVSMKQIHVAEGWDSSFSFDRCCSLTSVKRYADFRFDPPAKSHYELLHLERDNKPRLGPVQDDEALLLYGLVRALRPRTIVEFGTSNGFSALNWMHAISDCPDARVFSYDILPYPAARALEDSDPRFMFHQKSQADFEPADVDGRPVDVAFFDAGHLIEYSLKAFERLRPSLAANAIVAVHDTGLHVRDFGSGAPPEEEGQPFSEASCALRAGGPARCYRFRDCQGEADAQGFCVGRAHRPSERQFVAEVLKRWPDFRPLHIHSRRVFRHGLTLLQRGDLLGPDNPDGTF